MKFLFVAGAFLVALLGQGNAQDTGLNACASGCVNGVFLNAPSIGCAMNDRLCVCGKTTDFADGIRDCVNQVCGSDAAAQLPLAQSAGTDECKAASSAAGLVPTATSSSNASVSPTQATQSTVSTSSAATSSTTSPSSSLGPTSSAATASEAVTAAAAGSTDVASSSLVSTTPQSSSVVTSSQAPVSAASASASSSAVSSSPSDSASATGGNDETPTGTSSAEQSNDTSPTPESPANDDMTVAVRAGIGAGVGVAVVLLAILAAWLCIRRRKQKAPAAQGPNMQISQPLPGSGRQYADSMRQTEAGLSKGFVTSPTAHSIHQTNSHQSEPTTPNTPSAASYSSELDNNARRYEDMLPRTQPRTMI